MLAVRYGELLARQQRWAEAEPLLAAAYEGVKSQGIGARIGSAAASYGICLTRLGKFEQANPTLREAYERLSSPEIPPGETLRIVITTLVEVAEQT